MSGDLGAFVPHAPLGDYGPGGAGPLAGLTLAVKDLFDVAGLRTGGGTPAWLEGRAPATADAAAVAALRGAGARIVGKTVTDELAWSLNGENVHYGTPENVAAPGRVPGGSSAGSAAAVAGGLADVGLGSDTGGSVRLPASYCGLWGMRPSHGRISLAGCVPLAPSYDSVGWFAANPQVLARVGAVLLGEGTAPAPKRLLLATDLFDRVEGRYADALLTGAAGLAARLGLDPEPVSLAQGDLPGWRETFRICQSAEVWQAHGAWVSARNPSFGPGIADRFAIAAALSVEEITQQQAARRRIAERMHTLLDGGTVMLLPGSGAPPPPLGLTGAALDDIRARALDVMCPAGHAGLPQLALPAINTPEGPIGLGLIGASGGDETLLALAPRLATAGKDAP